MDSGSAPVVVTWCHRASGLCIVIVFESMDCFVLLTLYDGEIFRQIGVFGIP